MNLLAKFFLHLSILKFCQVSVSVENFIKTIYYLNEHSEKNAKPGSIASELSILNAATTDMARNTLINAQKCKSISLASKGQNLELSVICKHCLWETFLFEKLNLSLEEIHRDAELLEHQTSDFLADKIEEILGSPTVDPHGTPIPYID